MTAPPKKFEQYFFEKITDDQCFSGKILNVPRKAITRKKIKESIFSCQEQFNFRLIQ